MTIRLLLGRFGRIAIHPYIVLVVAIVLAWSFTSLINAQDEPDPIPVTDDEVNAIASRMYCPICEMEPLDTCGTSTCVLWRQQIREELEAGRTSDEIITGFVERYGDRVVGIPEDPFLRGLSLFGPIAIGLLGLIVGTVTFLRWRNYRVTIPESVATTSAQYESSDDKYLSQLESDLRD